MKGEVLRGTLVMYKSEQWSVVKVHDPQHVEIWRRGGRAVVRLSQLKIIG